MSIVHKQKQMFRSSEVLPLNKLFYEASFYERIMINGIIPD
jgi:hypothetical protein